DNDVECAGCGLDRAEQAGLLKGLEGVAREGLGADLGAERCQLLRVARSERYAQTFASEDPRQRRAQPAPGADDQRVLEGWSRHVRPPLLMSKVIYPDPVFFARSRGPAK